MSALSSVSADIDASSSADTSSGGGAGYDPIVSRSAAARAADPAWPRWPYAAILVCALFLQRFTLSFGDSLMSLDIVPIALIISNEILKGRLRVQPARLFWYFAAWSAAACSLVLNFSSGMLPSFGLFTCVYGFFTFAKSTAPEEYARILAAFQSIVVVLAFIAIAQFCLQFIFDGEDLIQFFGVFPDYLFTSRFHTIIPIYEESSWIKSNGLFLAEPSTLSEIAALALLIELAIFRRIRHTLLFASALLLSYSGTGILLLLAFLPFTVRSRRSRLCVLAATLFCFAVFVTGFVDISAFSSRLWELNELETSGFLRFVSPLWLARDYIESAAPISLLFGHGPGTIEAYASATWYTAFDVTWLKLLYEYGIVGSFLFVCFLIFCFTRSCCPPILMAAIIFSYVFLGGLLLNTQALALMIVLCSAPVSRPINWPVASGKFPQKLFAQRRTGGAAREE